MRFGLIETSFPIRRHSGKSIGLKEFQVPAFYNLLHDLGQVT